MNEVGFRQSVLTYLNYEEGKKNGRWLDLPCLSSDMQPPCLSHTSRKCQEGVYRLTQRCGIEKHFQAPGNDKTGSRTTNRQLKDSKPP